MNYDSFVTAAVAAEARSTVLQAWVESVYQPEPLLVVIGFYGRGGKTRWVFSADAVRPGVYRTEQRRTNPATPPGFCMLLRKYLEGARLASVETSGLERILRWRFERSDGAATLIAEVMGKHSNLVLIDDEGQILGAVKMVPAHKSRPRQIFPGIAYEPPPADTRHDARDLDAEAFAALVGEEAPTSDWLVMNLAGFGPFAAREVVARAAAPTEAGADRSAPPPPARAVGASLAAIIANVRAERFEPTVLLSSTGNPEGFWAFRSRQQPAERSRVVASISGAIDEVYSWGEQHATEDARRKELRAALKDALGRSERQRHRVEADLAGEAKAEAWRIDGELLAANLHKIQRGDARVEVVDYYDPEQRTRVVALDPELSPQENVERQFRKHRKILDAAMAALEQGEAIQAHHARLVALRDRIESAPAEALPELRREIATLGLLRSSSSAEPSSKRQKETSEYPSGVRIRRTAVDGWEILHGENSTSNDYLTTKVARPEDLWLHVRAAPSAHVVIRTGGRADRVPPRVLEEAARVAAAHSESRHSGLVPVDYVLRKYVRKPRGSAPGRVTYQNEKTLFISPRE